MKNKILLLLAYICLLPACSKSGQQDVPYERSLCASVESSEIGSKSYLNGLTVCWNKNDKVKVISTAGSAEFTIQGEGDTPDAVFKGTLGGELKAAVYPPSVYDSMSDNGEIMYVNIPATQSYIKNSFGPGANISVASITSDHAEFKNIGGMLRFHLTGSDIVSRIEIEGMAGEALCGKYAVIVATGAATIFSDGGTKVTLDCGSGVQLSDTETEFSIVVPVDAFETGFMATFYDKDGRKLDRAYTTGSARIFRRTITETSSREIIRDLCLEAGETANCYVIYAAGKYKFPADVMGNGTAPDNTAAPAITGMDDAALIWEMQNSTAAPEKNSIISSVEYSKGYVIFSTPAVLRPGNALVAVRDASDKILWSWHIWIPKTAIGSYTSGDLTIMDRQMGALTNTGTSEALVTDDYGFYYQWGRKDPFPAYAKRNTYDGETVPAALTGTQITFSSSLKSYAQIAGYPTVAYYNSQQRVVSDYNANAWKSRTYGRKTMYDPCPAGWRVLGLSGLGILQGLSRTNYPDWKGLKVTFPDGVLWMPNTGWMHNGDMRSYNTGLGLWLNESVEDNLNYWVYKEAAYTGLNLKNTIGYSHWRFSVIAEKDVPASEYGVTGNGSASDTIGHYSGMEW